MKDDAVREIGYDMVSGNRGRKKLRNDDVTTYVFYTPIEISGWSVAMVCPFSDIYSGTVRMSAMLFIILFIDLIFIFLIVNVVIGKMTQPLHSFSKSARKIAEGDFMASLPVINTKDEMMMLRDSFSFMQTSLVNYINQLKETTSAKERIEKRAEYSPRDSDEHGPENIPILPGKKRY